MSIQFCALLAVIVICITVLITSIIEHYPQWCTYYEYKQKAELYDKLKEQNNKDLLKQLNQ